VTVASHQRVRNGLVGRSRRRNRGDLASRLLTYSSQMWIWDLYSDGTTYQAIAVPNGVSPTLSRQFALGALDPWTQAAAILYDQWRLDALEFEFAPYAASTQFAFGWQNDAGVSFPGQSGSSCNQILSAMQGSKLIDAVSTTTGSGYQRFRCKLDQKWLYTSNNLQTTIASYRQVVPGAAYAAWSGSAPAAGLGMKVIAKYKISFRNPTLNTSINRLIPAAEQKGGGDDDGRGPVRRPEEDLVLVEPYVGPALAATPVRRIIAKSPAR